MYYKAILYKNPDIKFEVEQISDEDALTLTFGVYGFYNDDGSGSFAVRKSKNAAIKAIKKGIVDNIKNLQAEIDELKNIKRKIEENE